MRPGLLILIIIYWLIIGIVFSVDLDSPMNDGGFTGNSSITDTIDNSSPMTGVFLVDILRLLGIIFLGIGLPATVPIWFSAPFMIWQFGISVTALISIIS